MNLLINVVLANFSANNGVITKKKKDQYPKDCAVHQQITYLMLNPFFITIPFCIDNIPIEYSITVSLHSEQFGIFRLYIYQGSSNWGPSHFLFLSIATIKYELSVCLSVFLDSHLNG